jgi:hypothetical protein
MKHIATGRALSPGENYSILIMGDSNVEEDGGEVNRDGGGGDSVDRDGSGGTSPSRLGGGTETSVPRNSSVVVAELRDFFWKIADCFRVFSRETFYRQKGGVRGRPGPPHHMAARARGHATQGCGCPLAPLRLSFGLRPSSGTNRSLGLCFVQFREYFLCSSSKTQK